MGREPSVATKSREQVSCASECILVVEDGVVQAYSSLPEPLQPKKPLLVPKPERSRVQTDPNSLRPQVSSTSTYCPSETGGHAPKS